MSRSACPQQSWRRPIFRPRRSKAPSIRQRYPKADRYVATLACATGGHPDATAPVPAAALRRTPNAKLIEEIIETVSACVVRETTVTGGQPTANAGNTTGTALSGETAPTSGTRLLRLPARNCGGQSSSSMATARSQAAIRPISMVRYSLGSELIYWLIECSSNCLALK